MNILHLILLGRYTDGFSYQDNILPKYHKLAGNNVSIIASKLICGRNGKDEYYQGNSVYTDLNGIAVTRLDYKPPVAFSKLLRRYKGLENALEAENPDIMFIHGCQFLDMSAVVKYLKKHPGIRVFVDNHADFNNSATNFLSKNILHKMDYYI